MVRVPPALDLDPAVMGFIGGKRTGKSTLAAAMRQAAGSTARSSDIEFSDPIMEAVNIALGLWPRQLEVFRYLLIAGTARVTGLSHADCKPLADFPKLYPGASELDQSLETWLDGQPINLRLTRDNKDEHRAALIWLGMAGRILFGYDVWPNEVAKRIKNAYPSPLVTVGGARQPEDVIPIRDLGGVVCRVRSMREPESDGDATNARNQLIVPDLVVHNDVPEDRVPELAELIWGDWQTGEVQFVYCPCSLRLECPVHPEGA